MFSSDRRSSTRQKWTIPSQTMTSYRFVSSRLENTWRFVGWNVSMAACGKGRVFSGPWGHKVHLPQWPISPGDLWWVPTLAKNHHSQQFMDSITISFKKKVKLTVRYPQSRDSCEEGIDRALNHAETEQEATPVSKYLGAHRNPKFIYLFLSNFGND